LGSLYSSGKNSLIWRIFAARSIFPYSECVRIPHNSACDRVRYTNTAFTVVTPHAYFSTQQHCMPASTQFSTLETYKYAVAQQSRRDLPTSTCVRVVTRDRLLDSDGDVRARRLGMGDWEHGARSTEHGGVSRGFV
jgi:hypothetical protein